MLMEQVGSDEAARFWLHATQASAFTQPASLEKLSARVDWWILRDKKGNALSLWPICLNSEGVVELPHFAYFVGPVFSDALTHAPDHRRWSVTARVIAHAMDELADTYAQIRLSLSPAFTDIRGFRWWAEERGVSHNLKMTPMYTAIIEGIESASMADLIQSFRDLRKRELERNYRRPLVEIGNEVSVLELCHLYDQVVNLNNNSLQARAHAELQSLHRQAITDRVEVISLRANDSARTLVYCSVILIAKATANLIVNLCNRDFLRDGVSAVGIVNTIERAKISGCSTFDFNGANSPQRGDDKHSYGALPKLYFDIVYG